MSDDHVFEYTHVFDKRFLHDALKRDIYWRIFALLFGLILVFVGMFWLMGSAPWEQPTLNYLIGALMAAVAMPWFIMRRVVNRTYEFWSKQSPERKIVYRAGPDAIDVQMPNGHGRHEWKGLRRLWRYKDIWLLEVVKMTSVLFPADAPQEMRDYITERCREAGVTVKP